ncbi:glutathione synthase [bacterium]|nr:glutathione synthase [bacterium]
MLRIGLQMEPLAQADGSKSTSYALAKEAAKRGHRCVQFLPHTVHRHKGDITISHASHVEWRDDGFVEKPVNGIKGDALDVVLIRQDPPYDMGYLTNAHLWRLLDGKVKFINPPAALIEFPEKIAPMLFPDLVPETLIGSDPAEFQLFLQQHGEIIIKPLYAFGGEAVLYFKKGDSNLIPAVELMLSRYNVPCIAQRFIPEVKKGDARILLMDGEVIGAFHRVPQTDAHRANLMAGGSLANYTLSKRDHEICESLKPWLKNHGIFFAGIDVIGDYLTEINITSPLGIAQVKKLTGQDLAVSFWDKVEASL